MDIKSTRKEDSNSILWEIPSQRIKESNEFILFFKNKNLVQRGNSHWHSGGIISFTKEELKKDFVNIVYYDFSCFEEEVIKEIECLLNIET